MTHPGQRLIRPESVPSIRRMLGQVKANPDLERVLTLLFPKQECPVEGVPQHHLPVDVLARNAPSSRIHRRPTLISTVIFRNLYYIDCKECQVPREEKILVVDDDSSEREGLAELLRMWGYNADVAADGQQAIDQAESFNPSVIISDLRMPGTSG